MVSCCFSPNHELHRFARSLDELGEFIRANCRGRVLVAGDWNTIWGAGRPDHRGLLLVEWMNSMGLVSINEGRESTCVRWRGESIVDVTMASPAAARLVDRWRVDDRFNYSDHKYITMVIRQAGTPVHG